MLVPILVSLESDRQTQIDIRTLHNIKIAGWPWKVFKIPEPAV